MAVVTRIAVKHGNENAQSIQDELYKSAGDLFGQANALATLFAGLGGGTRVGRVDVQIEDVTVGDRATGTIVVDTNANLDDGTDTMTIGTTTLTWATSAANENQVTIGGDAGASADNLATAINAHSILSQYVTAASDGVDTVTLTARQPGVIGEAITLAVSDGTAQSVTAMTGVTGTLQAAQRSYSFGQT